MRIARLTLFVDLIFLANGKLWHGVSAANGVDHQRLDLN